MAFYESWTVDQLTRALTASKWVLGISGVVFAFVGVANQWITDRISTLQRAEKTVAQERTRITQDAIIVGSGAQTPAALSIQQAFRGIGIDAIGTDGRDIAKPEEIKIYVGSK